MYLANLKSKTVTHYQIRKSFLDDAGGSHYKLIFDLGENPVSFIEPYEDHVVFFDSELIRAVSRESKRDGESILEELLWNFLPAATRELISRFKRPKTHHLSSLSEDEREAIASQVHLFDRRRLYYLRYGAVDQSRLSRLHEKCCRPLLGQSRDEREFYFAAEEALLRPGDYQQYVYAIFDIQKNFSQSFAPWFPEALAIDEIADYFITDLCSLNRDQRFWQSETKKRVLHHHLVRYLIMFFDFVPAQRSYLEDFAKSFMADHRRFRWPDKKPRATPEKISEVFQTPYKILQQMTGDQLNKMYRKKALQLHPDKGGDHDLFIELTEVYSDLLKTKK